MAVLYGVFMFMGVAAMNGMQVFILLNKYQGFIMIL